MSSLFDFVQWIEYCYVQEYTERKFDAHMIHNANAESKRIEAEYPVVGMPNAPGTGVVDFEDKTLCRTEGREFNIFKENAMIA